ncbi:MAG: hypothetical protein ICV77_02505 [Cyanobacteria bacterium Co-bin8]|nr:hypothetical protein [Cyanobacteria bacterium Co-bin8]
MTPSKRRSWIFLFTSRVIKYLLLALFGFGMVCLITPIFGNFQILETLVEVVLQGFWRLAIVVLCLMAASAVVESLRQ